MAPLLLAVALTGILSARVEGNYLYRYMLMADGQCNNFKRCRGAETLTECKSWSKIVQGSAQNVTTADVPSPYGCVLMGDEEQVLYRSKKNVTCSASQKCICRCEDSTRYKKGTANHLINVALYADAGATARGKGNAYTVLNYEEANMRTVNFSASDFSRHLTNNYYDAVYFPGGGGGTQGRALGPEGIAAVRDFVANGGGYVGVCAGAYLAIQEMKITAFEDVTRPEGHARGDGNTTLVLTDEGAAALPKVSKKGIEEFDFFYANGPVMDVAATIPEGVTDPVVLARYHSTSVPIEANYTGPYAGYGFAAVVSSVWNGSSSRVVISGPHPETNEMDFPDLDGPPSAEGSERAHLLQAYMKHAVPGVASSLGGVGLF